MCKLYKSSFIGIVLLNLVLLSSIAEANDCNKESPYFIDGEKYYDLGLNKKLTNNDEKELSAYFNKLSGEWTGDLIHTECKGSQKSPKKITKKAKVTSNIRNAGNGVLKVSYDANYLESRISTLHKIETLGTKSIFVLNFLSADNLNFTEKYRRRNAAGGSSLIENIFDIQVKKDAIEIHLTAYLNGFFAWSDTLKLQAK